MKEALDFANKTFLSQQREVLALCWNRKTRRSIGVKSETPSGLNRKRERPGAGDARAAEKNATNSAQSTGASAPSQRNPKTRGQA
jgi:hypothetical protein